MMAAGRKDNAEAQRTRSFAEQEHEMRLPRGSADFAEAWESDGYGGLGTSLFALFVRPRSGGAPRFYRGPAAAVNSGECAVPVRGDGSPILPGGEPRRMQRTREARELETEYLTARC